MNILAIDTSNDYLSLGINSKEKLYQQQLQIGNRHSQAILPEIDNLIKNAGLTIRDINLIAYNYGPGAFTGLRIGLGCALGLSYSIKAKLAAIPAFMLYSGIETSERRYLGVCLDARLNQIYFAIIDQSDYTYLHEPCLIEPENLHHIITDSVDINADNFQITGTGIEVYHDKINVVVLDNYRYHEQKYPAIKRMLDLVKNGHYHLFDCNNADLMYVRNKVALNLEEQQRSKQQV